MFRAIFQHFKLHYFSSFDICQSDHCRIISEVAAAMMIISLQNNDKPGHHAFYQICTVQKIQELLRLAQYSVDSADVYSINTASVVLAIIKTQHRRRQIIM